MSGSFLRLGVKDGFAKNLRIFVTFIKIVYRDLKPESVLLNEAGRVRKTADCRRPGKSLATPVPQAWDT